ncbi:MAG: ComEC/Rec2 family competence protein, partial [bacterium]
MRMTIRFLVLCLLATLLAGCGAGFSEARGGQSVTLFAATVGKGDALILKVDDWAGLIDTGRPKAMSRVKAALKVMNVTALDAVFLTHTDNDHAGGLEWLAQSDIPVGTWYASAMYTGVKEKKHPALQAAAVRGEEVHWLRRGDVVSLGHTGAALNVLAPNELFTDSEDNNSLVMMLETAQGRMLLTGDMELNEEASLLSKGDNLSCAVLKVPKHADEETLSDAFARRVHASVGIISTDSREKPGTPDPGVLSRLSAAGVACYVTQDAGLGIQVTLNGGQAAVEYLNITAPMMDVRLVDVVPGEDIITLRG